MQIKSWLFRIYNKLPIIREFRSLQQDLADLRHQLLTSARSEMIRFTDFELSHHPRYGDPRRLLKYEHQVCSQAGEDGIIHEIFRRIGTTNRVFAEIGVGDGRENNTAFLLSQGWTGFWVEGDGSFVETIRNRPDLANGCIRYKVSFVTKENVAGLFNELSVPAEIDLLSIDVDQNTFFIWEGLSQYRPRVIVVEYNAAIPADVEWGVKYDPNRCWDNGQNFGASLKAYEKLGAQLGYSLVGCNFLGSNAFFVRNDLVEDRFLAPYTSENHYEPARYATLFLRHHRRDLLDRK